MKAKLIKDHTDYHLVDDEQFIIGTTDKVMLSYTDNKQKLSLTNCQAIERGYDLDELADELASKHNNRYTLALVALRKGMELMGDKKFSEDDVISMIEKSRETGLTAEYLILTKQQTKWDVEVEMDAIPADRAPGGWDRFPKLDSDGCLILKPLPKE